MFPLDLSQEAFDRIIPVFESIYSMGWHSNCAIFSFPVSFLAAQNVAVGFIKVEQQTNIKCDKGFPELILAFVFLPITDLVHSLEH